MKRPVPPSSKLLTADEALRVFGRPRSDRVVFTNGCFDILHRGHVEYLFSARAMGDRLIVGLNGDGSVTRLKGEGRPVNPYEDRAIVLAGLEAVDAVARFDEDTPLALIAALLPDVLVKGGDYRADDIVGAAEVRKAGGEVAVVSLVEGRSTTGIIDRLTGEGSDG